MNISITQVPAWLSILFVVSFITVPVLLIANTVQKVLKRTDEVLSVKIAKHIKFFYWGYFSLIALVSLTGFFVKNVLPPRILFFAAIPLFLFYLWYVQKQYWFQKILESIRLEELIFIHVFRFVGVFFFLVYAYGVLPKTFAYIGGAGDIVTAILVYPVIISLKRKLKYTKLIVWIWNIIGLLDIILVLITAFITTKEAIQYTTVGVAQFGAFPFSWIPAFAPATIIFLHILIIKKLIK